MTSGPVLVLFAHPALQKSRINSHLLAAIQGVDGISIHDLYEEYPDFHVDVDREQRRMEEHQTIVCQHPFYWYSAPALLKQWQDLVLEYEWAYGPNAVALRGKTALTAISTGGKEHAYTAEGYNRFPVPELLRPFEQTAGLCGMEWLPPFVLHGARSLTDERLANEYAPAYRRLLEQLRDGTFDRSALGVEPYINHAAGIDSGV